MLSIVINLLIMMAPIAIMLLATLIEDIYRGNI